MSYNKFYIRLFITIFLSCVLGAIALWSFTENDLVVSRFILSGIWIISISLVFRFLYKTTNIIKSFSDKIKESDFIVLPESKNIFGKELNGLLQHLNKSLKSIKIEKEEQFHLFKTAVNQSNSGIVVYDSNGKVHLHNQSANILFNTTELKNINNLISLNNELPSKFITEDADSFLINIQNKGELYKLSVQINKFKIGSNNLKVASIQNISEELEKEELDAWKKLMHVMVHEIMNSVTPMKTLSYSLYKLYENDDNAKSLHELNNQDITDTHQGLKALNKRMSGLMHFVESYRKLYKVPEPEFSNFNLSEILDEIKSLFSTDLNINKITLIIKNHSNLKLFADKNLITQVLINLVKNAMEALDKVKSPEITITCTEQNSRQLITVTDNGTGIEPEILADIFVPFYTTKKDGAGIGLYYSKLILLMHKGNLKVKSIYGSGASFTIQL